MILHCPFCGKGFDVVPADVTPENVRSHGHSLVIPHMCGGCGKVFDAAAVLSALCGFPLLGADERWRKEACGGCAFMVGIPGAETCRAHPPRNVVGGGDTFANEYTRVYSHMPACAEWAERRGAD